MMLANSDHFANEVQSFVNEIKELLASSLEGETTLENFWSNKENKRASFTIRKSLRIANSLSDRLNLKCVYRLCTNSTGNHLATEASTFKIEFRSTKKFVPIVRFEYERNARTKPASHFQFHADSVELGLLLARAGKYETAAQQQNVHFPMGRRSV